MDPDSTGRSLPHRLRGLRIVEVAGLRVPVATTPVARLLGLALLDRDRAGPGLLIPRCRCVHTFGMRFALDLLFLDRDGQVIDRRLGVPPRRVAFCRQARAVLEIRRPGAIARPRRP
jgi:uncharacterized membrane protein (UPF0127 family)